MDIPVFWTKYSATVHGRILKLVPVPPLRPEFGRPASAHREGRNRAVMRTEFEAMHQPDHGAEGAVANENQTAKPSRDRA